MPGYRENILIRIKIFEKKNSVFTIFKKEILNRVLRHKFCQKIAFVVISIFDANFDF